MLSLILALVFLGTVLLLVGGYMFLNRRRLAAADAARERLSPSSRLDGVTILRDTRASGIGLLDRLLRGRSLTTWLESEIRRSGSDRKVGEFILATLLASSVGATIGQRVGVPIMLLLAVLGGAVPFWWIRRRQALRQRKFEAQLPDAIDMLVNALRAGYSLQAAMEFVGREIPEPLGPEFARVYEEQRFGVEARTALVGLQERVGTGDVKMLVTSLLIQRETGGNLAEILTNIANLMRERVAFRGLLATLVAEPKMSARLLAAMPPAMFFVLLFLNPTYMSPLLTTPGGNMILVYAALSVVAGFFLMTRIADVDM